jgi:hypothetical protein
MPDATNDARNPTRACTGGTSSSTLPHVLLHINYICYTPQLLAMTTHAHELTVEHFFIRHSILPFLVVA